MLRAVTNHLDRRRLSSICIRCRRAVNVKPTPWVEFYYTRTSLRRDSPVLDTGSNHGATSRDDSAPDPPSWRNRDRDVVIPRRGKYKRKTGASSTKSILEPYREDDVSTGDSSSFRRGSRFPAVREILYRRPGWQKRIVEAATDRSVSPLALGLHFYIKELADRGEDLGSDVRRLFPDSQWWEDSEDRYHGITSAAKTWAWVLDSRSDDARADKVLELHSTSYDSSHLDWAMVSFAIHYEAQLASVPTLHKLMDLYQNTMLPSETFRRRDRELWSLRATSSLSKLAHHCHRIEPRMILRLPALTKVVLESCKERDAAAVYRFRSDVFNKVLDLASPSGQVKNVDGSFASKYVWEAQKEILQMATDYDPPLLMNRESFRAIRRVMASLPKDQVEKLNSSRHTDSWPPYLAPSDGLDESSAPEDNWSRTAKAGSLMQEAGYQMETEDIVLDVLQGVDPEGTPTIQQRFFPGKSLSEFDEFSARVLATRNEREAWQVFKRLRDSGSKPSGHAYAVMFIKHMQRQQGADEESLPGDKSINYPLDSPWNLTALEMARLEPPSVTQLRDMMREDGVRLTSTALRVLIANADTLELAHQYLRESQEPADVVELLTTLRDLTREDVRTMSNVRFRLLRDYLQVSCRVRDAHDYSWLVRSISLVELHMQARPTTDASQLWRPVLQNLEQHSEALRLGLAQHMQHLLRVMDYFVKRPYLWVFQQCNKTVRKMLRSRLEKLLAALEQGLRNHTFVTILASENVSNPKRPDVQRGIDALRSGRDEPLEDSQIRSAGRIGDFLTDTFEQLARNETFTQQHSGAAVKSADISALDVMSVRQDPCRAEHALHYMLALAYLGKTQSMAKYLEWLIKQWSDPGLVNELGNQDPLPAWADFDEVLCVFRMLAEPMLSARIVAPLRAAIEEVGLPWRWPSEDALAEFRKTPSDPTIPLLEVCLRWIRHYQTKGLIPPRLWQDEGNGGSILEDATTTTEQDGEQGQEEPQERERR